MKNICHNFYRTIIFNASALCIQYIYLRFKVYSGYPLAPILREEYAKPLLYSYE